MLTVKLALMSPVSLPILGTMSVYELIVAWVPIFYITIGPLLCVLLTLIGLCRPGSSSYKMSARMMRKVMLAVRADARMGVQSRYTRMAKAGFRKGGPSYAQPTANAIETGLLKNKASKSPNQAKGKAEEAAIKAKATKK